jgi:GT2 family glycosyltransferase
MINTVDLVMWTKNGAETLPLVLKRISEVIPSESVSKRIIIDDRSTDDTMEIAKCFGWDVIFNEGKGISDGANTALKHVKTEYFCSFEQDLLLASDWWSRLYRLLGGDVAVCSGMHLSNTDYLRKLEQYAVKKYRGETYLSGRLRNREKPSFTTLGKTLDNTMYRTEVLRGIGGFPKLKSRGGVDTVLAYKLKKAGYQWLVDYDVQSIHLHGGLSDELEHYYWYGLQVREICRSVKSASGETLPVNTLGIASRLFTSPMTGLVAALRMRDARIAFAHPLIRLYYLRGLLKSC